jgi:hypothetical protein
MMQFAAAHPEIISDAFMTIGFVVVSAVVSIVLRRETH